MEKTKFLCIHCSNFPLFDKRFNRYKIMLLKYQSCDGKGSPHGQFLTTAQSQNKEVRANEVEYLKKRYLYMPYVFSIYLFNMMHFNSLDE